MKIGVNYKVQRTISSKEASVTAYGKCIWIHPKGRFAVVQFPDGIRECYTQEEMR